MCDSDVSVEGVRSRDIIWTRLKRSKRFRPIYIDDMGGRSKALEED